MMLSAPLDLEFIRHIVYVKKMFIIIHLFKIIMCHKRDDTYFLYNASFFTIMAMKNHISALLNSLGL